MSNIKLGGSFLHFFVCLFNIFLLCSFIFIMEHNKWTNESPCIDKLSRKINYLLTHMLYLLSKMFISSRQVVSLAFYETNHIWLYCNAVTLKTFFLGPSNYPTYCTKWLISTFYCIWQNTIQPKYHVSVRYFDSVESNGCSLLNL